jgi:putative transposase
MGKGISGARLAGSSRSTPLGRPIEIDGQQRYKITVLACSQPPEGYAQWSLRLLADKAIELGYVEVISHTEVRKILKKTI